MKVQTDHKEFLRDTNNRALINNNVGELQMLRSQRMLKVEHKREIDDLRREMAELKKLILER